MVAAEKISLSGSVGVAQAADVYSSVQTGIAGGNAVEFNLADVRDIDASILQLFIAAQKAAAEHGTEALLTDLPESIVRSFASHGASILLPDGHSLTDEADRMAGDETANVAVDCASGEVDA